MTNEPNAHQPNPDEPTTPADLDETSTDQLMDDAEGGIEGSLLDAPEQGSAPA